MFLTVKFAQSIQEFSCEYTVYECMCVCVCVCVCVYVINNDILQPLRRVIKCVMSVPINTLFTLNSPVKNIN